MNSDPRALLEKARKAYQGATSGFSFFGGRTEKYENAADLYTQAANAFLVQDQYKEAGQAFEKAASIQEKDLKEPNDAANSLYESYKAYQTTDPEDAVRVLSAAIEHWVLGQGGLRRAAPRQEDLARVYEEKLADTDKAIEAYEKAAKWYGLDSVNLANKNYLKAADLAAFKGDYIKAIDYYERVARSTKYLVKECLLKAGICHLATQDMVTANRAMETYREIGDGDTYPFTSTREHQLLVDLIKTIEDRDQEAFSDKLFQYDQFSKLDKWKTTILLRVKNGIEGPEEDDFA
ncbi:soluble NSF attachment protein [Aspergillus egyptiacus]|nr:soluble NSF attachment protein [Aspergillus egyptiacus]